MLRKRANAQVQPWPNLIDATCNDALLGYPEDETLLARRGGPGGPYAGEYRRPARFLPFGWARRRVPSPPFRVRDRRA